MDGQQPWQVVGVTPETKADFEALDDLVWFAEVDPADDDPSGALELSRCFAATRTGAPPFSGVYGWFDLGLTVPGPDGPTVVPCAGLTWVGVHPDDRRSGVLSAMLDHHLAALHDEGVVLGGLHASEPAIYGRFGYAQASFEAALEVGGGADVTAPDGLVTDGIRTTLVDSRADGTAERVHRIQHEVAARSVGQVALTEKHHRRRLRPYPPEERDTERLRVLVAQRDGADVGYALVRRKHKWTDAMPQGTLTCDDLTADDPAVRLALLRRLVSFDLIGTVTLPAESVEDPAVWWLGGPRAVKARTYDALWLRLVDLPAALALRGWRGEADLVLDVADERCPWNAGRWRLGVADGRATCERTEDAADVRLPVQALASAYLGGRSMAAMARQGLVEEVTPGAVGTLGATLATDAPPVAALGF